jgi:hypothetical protein
VADVKRYSLIEISRTVIQADKPAWVSIEAYAALEARLKVAEDELEWLRPKGTSCTTQAE